MTPRRVLLVEDDSRLRSQLAAALRRREGLRIVGEVEAAEPALALLRQGLKVDVALVDLGLPGMSGQELISVVKAGWPGVEVLVLTGFADEESIYEALRAGAGHPLYAALALPEVDLEAATRAALARALADAPPRLFVDLATRHVQNAAAAFAKNQRNLQTAAPH